LFWSARADRRSLQAHLIQTISVAARRSGNPRTPSTTRDAYDGDGRA
jgi:hypothetical protein